MASGRKTALTIRLTPADRQTLLAWQRAPTISAGHARRGRMLLLLAAGMPIAQIARTVGLHRHTVYKWVQRFLRQGLEGLADQPRDGMHLESSTAIDRNDTQGHRRLRIHGIPLLQTCKTCAGTAFEASTAQGSTVFFVKLPFLRCTACQCVYRYNRGDRRWGAVTAAGSTLAFVRLEDLETYMAKWE